MQAQKDDLGKQQPLLLATTPAEDSPVQLLVSDNQVELIC